MTKNLNLFLSLLFLTIISEISFAQVPAIKEAFDYLNELRANPSKFNDDIGVDLSAIESKPALNWNDTLAFVAQHKAEDMANNNYFGHIDPKGRGINILILESGYSIPKEWAESKSNNYFESITAGIASPKEGIITLIRDGGETDHSKAGHRVHLLGIDSFYKNCYDIGIGWAQNPNSKYTYYMSVVLAKHNW